MILNRKIRRVLIAALAAQGLIIPAQSKLWTPPKPAIIKAEKDWRLNVVPCSMTMGLMISASAAPVPTVVNTNTSTTVSSSTTHVVNLPASLVSGNLLLIAIACGTNANFTLPSGWAAELIDDAGTTGTNALWIAYKFSNGAEGASVSVTSSGGIKCAHASIQITGNHASVAPEISAVVRAAASTTHNPASLTPSWGALNTLWIAFVSFSTSSLTISSYPTNYTDNQIDIGQGTVDGELGIATRALNAATEDAGAFTLSSTSDGRAVTIAVRPV